MHFGGLVTLYLSIFATHFAFVLLNDVGNLPTSYCEAVTIELVAFIGLEGVNIVFSQVFLILIVPIFF
jgi:hypothetical protein